MNVDIRGVHYEISEEVQEKFDKKLKRLSFADDLIIDLLITIKRGKNDYVLETNINFRWGGSAHLRVETFDLFKGIEQLFDKMDAKIHKEKEKIQEH